MKAMISISIILAITLSSIGLSQCTSEKTDSEAYKLNLTNLQQVAQVDSRYQSVNVEMCEVVGGDFWIPYDLLDSAKVAREGFNALKRKIPPVDLYEKKLRMLATALGPMYVRVSGTWANNTYFQDDDEPRLASVTGSGIKRGTGPRHRRNPL
jgi:heparanase 1